MSVAVVLLITDWFVDPVHRSTDDWSARPPASLAIHSQSTVSDRPYSLWPAWVADGALGTLSRQGKALPAVTPRDPKVFLDILFYVQGHRDSDPGYYIPLLSSVRLSGVSHWTVFSIIVC